MAATSKSDLIAVTEKELGKLADLIAACDVNTALQKRDDETSIKDIIGHRAHWIDLFLGWYADGLAGKDVQFPAPGYKWNELKRYNADLRQQQADLGWYDATALLDAKHQDLLILINRLSDGDLYGAPMKGARNDWTVGRWAEAAGASHYRSAAKYLRACLKADKSNT